MLKRQQVIAFCDKSWYFINFAPIFYQICGVFFVAHIKEFSIELFCNMLRMQNSSQDMVMEN